MNPDLKNLRVAVVPTETDNGIDQNSSYEEIVACKETTYYSVSDYFKAQNNEEIDLLHWSFLLDYEKKVDITGTNTDGIDYNQKAINIERIKSILAVWGSTSCTERECESSPTLNSLGSGDICELVETFYSDSVETIVYDNGTEKEYNSYQYEELSEEIIDEILEIVDEYEADMLKTEKRCAD